MRKVTIRDLWMESVGYIREKAAPSATDTHQIYQADLLASPHPNSAFYMAAPSSPSVREQRCSSL